MLYLNPPFPIISGVALFPDHANALQWYYMPAAPRLSTIPDSATGQARPSLHLIKFRGEAGVGGFLDFDVNVGVDDDVLDDVRQQLRGPQFKLPPGTIRLSPVPLSGGTVKLLVLGQESPGPTPPPGPAGAPAPTPAPGGVPKFVTKISHDAHPSLYNDNQAAFSVALDQYGVTVLEQALAGNMAPVGVVYSLQFLGLRPAYSVHLHVDWDRVQKHMDEHFGVDTLFTSVDIDNAVDELIEKKYILLEADTFVPEGEDTASIISSRDRALNEVRDMITDAFFTSSIDPVKPRAGDWDKAMQVAGRVGALIATGGWGGVGTFSYAKQNYTRIDQKVLEVNIRERTTVERSIYPQGHLTGLFQVLRDQHLSMSDFVTEANLDDPWFQHRRVSVISRANYDADSVGSVNVTLTYGAEPHNVVLDRVNQRQDVQWLSRVTNGAMELPVTVTFGVNFQGVDGTERPLHLESAPAVVSVENVEIEPRTLYSIVPVPIAVPNPATFPWARYPSVEVHGEYLDPVHGIHDETIVFLKADAPEGSWRLFVQQSGPVSFRYKVIYRAADNKDYESDWRVTDAREVMVRDPFPSKRTVTVVPPAVWTSLDQVFVDVSYADAANGVHEEASFNFSEADHVNKTFAVDLRNPAERRVGFSVTFVDKNGGTFEVPSSYTLDNRIIVRSDMRGHRIVNVHGAKVAFDAKKIRNVQVDLRYLDPDAALQYAGQVTLASAGDVGTFEFDYVDPARPTYEYRLSTFFRNGMTQDGDWRPSAAGDLDIEL